MGKKRRYQTCATLLGEERAMGYAVSDACGGKYDEEKTEIPEEWNRKEAESESEYKRRLRVGGFAEFYRIVSFLLFMLVPTFPPLQNFHCR